MQDSATDTFLRAVVMCAVLGGLGWLVVCHTTLPRLAIQRAIAWYENQQSLQNSAGGPPANHPHSAPRSHQISDAQPIHAYQQLAETSPGSSAVQVTGGSQLQDAQPPRTQLAGHAQPIPTNGAATNPSAVADRRTEIETRLRDLGAVYTLLETWPRGEARYRFHCQVSFAGADETLSFEANAGNAVRAMQQVLRDVESWRAQVSHFDVPGP